MPSLPRAVLLASLGLLGLPRLAAADPMRLSDPHPRWVSVRFEISPEDQPGRLDTRYGDELPAWLERDRAPGRIRVTVPAHWVESDLLAREGARPGALSDFAWVFDARTGDVISATLSGLLVRRVGVGPFRFETEVEIQTELSTLAPAGFHGPEQLLGQRIFGYCNPLRDASCTPVRAIPYDPRTGYVNAVGFLTGRTARVTTRSFSPLGEARFSELDGATPWRVEWAGSAPRPPAVSAPAVSAPPPSATTSASAAAPPPSAP